MIDQKKQREDAAHKILLKYLDAIANDIDALECSEEDKAETAVAIIASLSARVVAGSALNFPQAGQYFLQILVKHFNNFAERDGLDKMSLKEIPTKVNQA